jgi:membrane associated rhomboid family serine protease
MVLLWQVRAALASMGLADRRYTTDAPSFGRATEAVKWLLIINIGIFVLSFFMARTSLGVLLLPFGLVPNQFVFGLAVWQVVTYLFLHNPFGFSHILFNMLALYMFGSPLEAVWGSKRFLKFYFVCGIGAGLCVVVLNMLFGAGGTRTIGSSGAIYGLILAFGMLFPEATILFAFLFPIKAKYFVMIIGAIVFLSSFEGAGGAVSNFAHLGGMVFGFFYLRSRAFVRGASQRAGLIDSIGQRYRNWKLQRAKRKFQVYLRKRNSGSDRWVQ